MQGHNIGIDPRAIHRVITKITEVCLIRTDVKSFFFNSVVTVLSHNTCKSLKYRARLARGPGRAKRRVCKQRQGEPRM